MTDVILDAWDKGAPMPKGGPPPAEPPVPRGEPDDPWQGAPFVCLGKAGQSYWFFDAAGEIVSLSARALGQWQDVLGLCGGRQDWLAAHWPAFDRDGVPTGGFNVRGVAAAVMRRCGEIPAFDPNEPRRRYGLWPVADAEGRPGAALHLGKSVLWCGEELRAGFSRAGALWPAMAPRPAPAPPCGAEVGRQLEALLARWNWAHADAPAVLLGLVVNGMLGALASWRAHGFVVGEFGCGKSALLTFIAGLCPLTYYRNDFTAAGVRQALSETSALVVLDEAEGDDRGDAMLKQVIELLRKSSSGQGVAGVRGSPEQQARSFSVAAAALMGATLPPALPAQDASRFTMLQLRPLPPDSTPVEAECQAFLATHAMGLWGRAVASAGRIVGLFRLFKERLVAGGATRRAADQLGIIAACHWAMTQEPYHDPREDAPENYAEALRPVAWLVVKDADRELDSGGNQALQRLLSMPLDMAGDKLLLGQALGRYRHLGRQLAEMDATWPDREATKAEQDKLDRLMQAHGVRWATMPLQPSDEAPAPPPGLYVAAGSHSRLLRAFDGTPWAGQRWAAAIAQLPEARGGRDAPPVRIGGAKMRACWVSRETLDRLTQDG
jgi:hypothetical protein